MQYKAGLVEQLVCVSCLKEADDKLLRRCCLFCLTGVYTAGRLEIRQIR